jgi:hypothetical protein
MGYGHGEEPFYLEVLDEFYDDIVRSYGDYGQTLNNFLGTKLNIDYIIKRILQRYTAFGYYRELNDCAHHLLMQIEQYKISVTPQQYLSVLESMLVASKHLSQSKFGYHMCALTLYRPDIKLLSDKKH